ncbi:Arc family DNA-binding protein [Pseudomonas sp. UMC65]|uniref:Arc family DNA-binding protein n=1 Tax=Pseudomonas sp. UMC65 TaxID=1862323 RepID=UPI001603C846|nr:Arc family DNA-binding protein [Pseudomonas sp. UMC65]
MNKQYDSRTADKFVVRLPEGLRAQVEQSAGTSDTSMNTVFIQALRQYLDNQGRQQVLLDALAAAYVRAGEKEHELRLQLAEQKTLLQLGLEMINRGIVSFDDQVEYRQKLAALSASAEPKCQDGGMCRDSSHKCTGCAPVERDERADFLAWACREYEVGAEDELNERNVVVIQNWAGWKARAALDKATEGASHE